MSESNYDDFHDDDELPVPPMKEISDDLEEQLHRDLSSETLDDDNDPKYWNDNIDEDLNQVYKQKPSISSQNRRNRTPK